MSYAWGRRSLEMRDSLMPELKALADDVLQAVPFDIALTDGHRGQEAQEAAFASGASKVRWPDSKHNRLPSYAMHLDPYPINYAQPCVYYVLAGIVLSTAKLHHLPIRWGGRWNGDYLDLAGEKFKDLAHWEMASFDPITLEV